MKKFETGDIVYYKYKDMKCIVKTYISNSVFEITYTIVSYDVIDGRYPRFKVKSGNIEPYYEYIRNKKISEILND